jgi:Na+/alanine symporter
MIEALIGAVIRQALPDGHTYEGFSHDKAIQEGRVDVVASHIAAAAAARNPMTAALFSVARPIIDGMLTATMGPVVLSEAVSKLMPVAATPRVKSVKRKRKVNAAVTKRKQFTNEGIEILDAEFVDIPEGQ